jgi:hypothetical protein
MPVRHLPVRPDLDQLKHQAKDLLRAIHAGDPEAIAELLERHPESPDPATAKLADAQLVLARSYDASSWTRLVQSAQLIDAIWRDDIDVVRNLVTYNPKLIHEDARIRKGCNWGPPMSYAANIGRDRIIRMLYDLGARDLEKAIDRATLQSQIGTATMLHGLLGNPPLPDGALSGPAYTLSVEGTAFALSRGARVRDENGTLLAPVDVVLETDARKPAAKHAILALYEQHGVVFPDTAPMAVHRGRIDLLEEHLRHDRGLVTRTFSHREIYPAEMGCGAETDAVVGTPLGGATLLHMCVDYDEMEIATLLLDKGMDVNARSAVGAGGFGGYTALFSTVVSMPNFWMNLRQRGPFVAPFTKLLLERGADPNVRASIWKRLHPGHADTTRHDYRDVTPLSWGRRFHDQIFVSEPAMRLIEEAGGVA